MWTDFPADQLRSFYYHAICAKSDIWDYEFEWRAILSGGGRKSHGYAAEDLTEIIFGVNTLDED